MLLVVLRLICLLPILVLKIAYYIMLNKKVRKTRKFPDMFGSIRKHKHDVAFARRFDKWQSLYVSKPCDICVSEPVCKLN